MVRIANGRVRQLTNVHWCLVAKLQGVINSLLDSVNKTPQEWPCHHCCASIFGHVLSVKLGHTIAGVLANCMSNHFVVLGI